jgi:hypothetical protein
MKRSFYILNLLIFLFFLILSFSSEVYAAVPVPGGGYWYKGNSHNHPETTDPTKIQNFANTYKNAGYDFIVLSDHNWSVSCSTQESFGSSGFLVLCGSELSTDGHVGAFGLNSIVSGTSNAQETVNRVINAGGVAVKNHPISDGWSASKFLGVNNLNHFEVANGGRMGQVPAAEVLWDEILSAPNGRPTYGIGTDDNHSGSRFQTAWVMVKANSLTKSQIVENFRSGNFYTSSGVTLSDYKVNYTNKTITIASNGNKITFIGKNGATLQTISSGQGTYQYQGTAAELYVRAKVTNSSGKAAWTQPVYFSGPPPTPSPGTPGDGNNDGRVDGKDFIIWLSHFGQNVSGANNGDYDNNGQVRISDYIVWVKNYTG